MTVDGTPGRPWWTVLLGVAVVLVVVVAVSGAIGRAELPSGRDPDQGVELPDRAEVEGDEGVDPCADASCELWRREDLDDGRVLVTERFAVHEALGTVTVVDLADGAQLWQREVTGGEPSGLYVDDEVIVAGRDAGEGVGARLVAVDTRTGEPAWERTFDAWASVSDLHAIAGEVALLATPAEADEPAVRVLVRPPDGEVRRLGSGPHATIRWPDGLLLQPEGEVVVVARVGARTVEWRADGAVVDVDLAGGRVLLRSPSGDYEVRDLASGARRWSTPGPGVLQVQFVGGWVGITGPDGMVVVDPDDGTERFHRDDVAPATRVAHLALQRHTVVAWPVEGGTEIVAYDEHGEVATARRVEGPDAASAWVTFAPVTGQPDLVQVVADAGRRSTWLALPGGEVARTVADDDPRPWDRDFREGLLWRSRTDQLLIDGPAGSITVDGASEVVSVSPLMVAGPDGLARLDPTGVLGIPVDG